MPITRRRLIALVGILVVALAVGITVVWHRFGSAAESTRVMIVGDSLTQGSQGDWTWRYRLDRHLHDVGADVDLVGPRRGLFDETLVEHDADDYADPDFDQDHLSQWGDSFVQVGAGIREQVSAAQPDVVVAFLGSNDLDTYDRTPAQVAASAELLVRDVRAARAGTDIVFGALPWFWEEPQRFNERLRRLAARMDTSSSRVVVAETAPGMDLPGDTWDGTHPTAVGEQKYAAAFADALASLGIGARYPRPLADVPVGPRTAPTVAARAGDGTAALTWSGAVGANGQRIWVRDLTADGEWQLVVRDASGGSHDVSGLVNDHDYAFRLQPVKGTAVAGDDVTSDEVTVRPTATVPTRASGPRVTSADHGVVAGWSPVEGADGYQVRVRNLDQRLDARVLDTDQTTVDVPGLRAGAPYAVAVRAVVDGAVGAWSPERQGVPTGPGLRVPTVSTRSTSRGVVRAAWDPVRHADGYVVQWRDATTGEPWTTAGEFGEWTSTSLALAGLPARHRVVVRVAARDDLRTGQAATARVVVR